MNAPGRVHGPAAPTAAQAQVLRQLQAWRDAGWLRPLDLALARFLHTLDPAIPPGLLLAAALVSQLESRGHSGLPVDAADPGEDPDPGDDLPGLARQWWGWLDWPAEARPALAQAVQGWPADWAALQQAWHASPVLSSADTVAASGETAEVAIATPLVLADGRLALRRHWRDEGRVAAGLRALLQPAAGAVARADAGAGPGAGTGADAAFDPAFGLEAARAWLDRLFPAAADAAPDGPEAIDWQQTACALALRSRLLVVTGGPGTGKTWTAARLLVLLQALHRGPQPLRVALAAPTGKAAARLRQSISQALTDLRATLGSALPAGLGTDAGAAALRSGTLHALLGVRPGTRRFVHDAATPLDLDLLFVDEASMVHLELMAALLQALPPQARLVLLGDRDQLASVEAGAVLGDLCAHAQPGGTPAYDPPTVAWVQALAGQALPPRDEGAGPGGALAQQTVALRRSRRFGGPIGELARAVNAGDEPQAQALLAAGTGVSCVQVQTNADIAARAIDGWRAHLQRLARRPPAEDFTAWVRALLRGFDSLRVLCALREGDWGVTGLNDAIERRLGDSGLLSCRGDWYEGRPVLVTRNDPGLGVFNGDIGIALRDPGPGAAGGGGAMAGTVEGGEGGEAVLRVWFADGDGLRAVAASRLPSVQTAWAMTVHKSQGSEFGHVLLVLPGQDNPVLTRELIYTGITRARDAFTLLGPAGLPLQAALARRTRRLTGLPQRLRAAGL